MDLEIKKGLDIPIKGKPKASLEALHASTNYALNLDSFDRIKFKVLVKPGDFVKKGQPLAENKAISSQMFASPVGGVVKEVRRGLKRRLLAIVVESHPEEEVLKLDPLHTEAASREQIVERLLALGVFPHIVMRPFSLIADPKFTPRDIFIKAIESAPFLPPAEMQVEGYEHFFQAGIFALQKLTGGKVHLVYRKGSACRAFSQAKGAEIHTMTGPHPAGNSSVHIHLIAPIRSASDVVWTLDTLGVIAVGRAVAEGTYHTERIVALGGEGVNPQKSGFFRTREGMPLSPFITNRVESGLQRYISGDPLTGTEVGKDDFLGFFHTAFSVIPENVERELFHFFRLGVDKYSATRAYLSGHLKNPKEYSFTTNQHGEERPFIDGGVYNKVMPMRIPTMQLVKAALADDFELAEQLGLLEVDPEDFALPSFVCPSKIEMMDIIREGARRYALEMGY